MDKRFAKDAFIWGFLLWLIGYVLGIALFFVVPKSMIGSILTPIGTVITLWVLAKKIQGDSLAYFLRLAGVWTLIAVVFDYLFNVQLFGIGSSYYQMDVYLYYALTFALPLVHWHVKHRTD